MGVLDCPCLDCWLVTIVDCHLSEVLGEKTWYCVVESSKVPQTVRLKAANELSTFRCQDPP